MDKTGQHRAQCNFQIEPYRPMLDVIQIVFDAPIQVGVSAPTVHLSPAGDAGLDHVLFHVIRHLILEYFDKIRALRPRPDQGHVALKHIDQLRQFVKAGFTQETAKPGSPFFARLRPNRTGFGFGIHRHRAELQHVERTVVPANPFLPIKHRAWRTQLDADCDQ